MKILLGVSGSISAFKAAELASALKKSQHDVRVVATPDSLQFVGPATWEGLLGEAPWTDLYTPGRMMDHIELVRWCDLFLVYPASATTISRMAQGLGDSLLSASYLACNRPVWLAPAMNTQMLQHPATARNLRTLAADGVRVLPTGEGRLACGEVGAGRLLEPSAVLQEISCWAQPDRSPLPRVIVTAGGTREALDSVRFLGNSSTGRTGVTVAAKLQQEGWDVHLLLSAGATASAPEGVKVDRFDSVDSLATHLRKALSSNEVTAVVHAAAVSDFQIQSVRDQKGRAIPATGKISSHGPMTLELVPGPKLIRQLRHWSANPKLKVVGFKLLPESSEAEREAAVGTVLESADWVVANEAHRVGPHSHNFWLYNAQGLARQGATTEELSAAICDVLEPLATVVEEESK